MERFNFIYSSLTRNNTFKNVWYIAPQINFTVISVSDEKNVEHII